MHPLKRTDLAWILRKAISSLSKQAGVDRKAAESASVFRLGAEESRDQRIRTRALKTRNSNVPRVSGTGLNAVTRNRRGFAKSMKLERETGVEPATSSLGNYE
jgi:hypothetical protein